MTISLINSQIKSQGHDYFITEALATNSKRTGTRVLQHAAHDGFSGESCSNGLMMYDKNKVTCCRRGKLVVQLLAMHNVIHIAVEAKPLFLHIADRTFKQEV